MYLVSVSSRTAVPVPAAAFDIRKGGTAMLAEQPQIISLTQLAVVAGCSRDHITSSTCTGRQAATGRSMTTTTSISTPTAQSTAPAAACRSTKATPGAATAAVSPSPCAAGWGRRPTTAMMPTWGSLPLRQCRPKKWRRQWRCS